MTPKTSPVFVITTKNIHKIFIHQKRFFFETPKIIEIQDFDAKTMVQAYVYMKISEYPPGGTCQLVPFDGHLVNQSHQLILNLVV